MISNLLRFQVDYMCSFMEREYRALHLNGICNWWYFIQIIIKRAAHTLHIKILGSCFRYFCPYLVPKKKKNIYIFWCHWWFSSPSLTYSYVPYNLHYRNGYIILLFPFLCLILPFAFYSILWFMYLPVFRMLL